MCKVILLATSGKGFDAMSVVKIIEKGDEILTKKAHKVTDFNNRLALLLDNMKDTLVDANGAGLAAPQVGILRRIFVVNDGEKITEYINPELILETGEQECAEGCLSVPGVYGVTKRPALVRLKAQDRHGKYFEDEGTGLVAQAFSHENDHLNGILFDTKIIRLLDSDEDDGDKES